MEAVISSRMGEMPMAINNIGAKLAENMRFYNPSQEVIVRLRKSKFCLLITSVPVCAVFNAPLVSAATL